jgi:hypothetical protein
MRDAVANVDHGSDVGSGRRRPILFDLLPDDLFNLISSNGHLRLLEL